MNITNHSYLLLVVITNYVRTFSSYRIFLSSLPTIRCHRHALIAWSGSNRISTLECGNENNRENEDKGCFITTVYEIPNCFLI